MCSRGVAIYITRELSFYSCKRSAEFCKEIVEKLARPGYLGGKVVSDARDRVNGALVCAKPDD